VRVLLVVIDPDGSPQRTATALQLARALIRHDDTEVRLFFTGHRVAQLTHDEVRQLVAAGVEVRVGPPVDPPPVTDAGSNAGLGPHTSVTGVEPSSIRGLSGWIVEADRVLVF